MKVVIIGAGPAGMMAAITARKNGDDVTILEKMRTVGRKLSITGKGRCNITNMVPIEDFFKNIPGNSKFLYSAFYSYTNEDLINELNTIGIKTKVERGQRVFPASDNAMEIVDKLKREMDRLKVKTVVNTTVSNLIVKDKKVLGVKTNNGNYDCDKVVIATGGKSYPLTGSTGDGYTLAKSVGHTIIEPKGSLVPIETYEKNDMQGLSLKNISIVVKPALSEEKLDKRVQRDFEEHSKKQFKNCFDELLPSKMIPYIIKLSKVDEEKQIDQLTKEERQKIVKLLKDITFTMKGFRPIEEAIITAGGVNVKEVNPSTMESKLIKGLYFAGEVLDVDAYTGGFNLQIAFSTGFLAGGVSKDVE